MEINVLKTTVAEDTSGTLAPAGGLNLALHNYLNGTGFDVDLEDWFEFPVVGSRHPSDLIEGFLGEVVGV